MEFLMILLLIFGGTLIAVPFLIVRSLLITWNLRISFFLTITVAIVALVFIPGFKSQSLIDRSMNEEAYWLDGNYDWKKGAALTRQNAYLIGLPWTFLSEILTYGPYPYSEFERFDDIKRYHKASWAIRWIFIGFYVSFAAYYLGRRFYPRRADPETYSEPVEPPAPWEERPEIPFGALHWRMGPGVDELNKWCADIREFDDDCIHTYTRRHPPPCSDWKEWVEGTIASVRAKRTRLRTNR